MASILPLATGLLGLALLGGLGAAAALLRGGRSSAWLAYAHGGMAVAGYALLLTALPGAHLGRATGTQSFGAAAAVLIGAALFAGIALLIARLRGRRPAGFLVGIHATLAVSGFVLLAVYVTLG